MRKFLTIALLLITLPSFATMIRRINFEALETVGVIDDIEQDNLGFIWLAGQLGLARYDGHNIKTYPNLGEDITDRYPWDLFKDSEGNLWVSSQGGLFQYDLELDNFQRLSTAPIKKIFEANDGKLLLGTLGHGLIEFIPSSLESVHYLHSADDDTTISGNNVSAISQDRDGNYWLGTDAGLNRYNKATRDFERFDIFVNAPHDVEKSPINSLLLVEDELWIGTLGSGIVRLNTKTNEYRYFIHSENSPKYIWDIEINQKGEIWFASDKRGVYVYNSTEQTFTRYRHSNEESNSLLSNVAKSLYFDHAEDMWVGHAPDGISIFDYHLPEFKNYRHSQYDENTISHPIVLSLLESKNGILWVGTENGLTRINPLTREFKRFSHVEGDENSLPARAILSITEDHDQMIWVGTWGGGLTRINPDTFALTHYRQDKSKTNSLHGQRIWSLHVDHANTLWVGTERGGLNRFHRETDSFTYYARDADKKKSLESDLVRVIYEDSKNNLWIGTLDGLRKFDSSNETFTHFNHDKNDITSLSAPWVKAIFEDSQGKLWIGTHGGGVNLFDPISGTFDHFTKKDGLSNNTVNSILEDHHGMIWFATEQGLTRFDPYTRKHKVFDKSYGLINHKFWRPAAGILRSGELMYGTVGGFMIFNPTDFQYNNQIPPVYISDFYIYNKRIATSTPDSPLTKSITFTDQLALSADQTSFTFELAALNYRISDKNQYSYRLHGYDKGWQFANNTRSITYTNLRPGNYKFEYRGSSDELIWSESKHIHVRITPPLYLSWYAYVLYTITIFSVILLSFKYVLSKQETNREKALNNRLKEVDKLKDEFLASTTHELRTPLNAIIGLTQLTADSLPEIKTEKVRRNLSTIIASGKRLATLINDILDFSKLKDHSIILNKKAVDIAVTVDLILQASSSLVGKRKLVLKNTIPKDCPTVEADENRLQQILYNLIGNAIKFTGEGEIIVAAEVNNDRLVISVKDTGIGIAEDMQDAVFISYEQAETSRGGTGLGLFVTKKLVELHGGEIYLDSTLGEGTTFYFTLPLPTEPILTKPPKTARPTLDTHCMTSTISHNNIATVMIVDDDPVNRMILTESLKTDQHIVVAFDNGIDALAYLQENKDVDLVLLDVMMNVISGFEVCEKIRESYDKKQLPVIFLSGLESNEMLEKMNRAGANKYIAKPIDIKYIRAVVNKFISLKCQDASSEPAGIP